MSHHAALSNARSIVFKAAGITMIVVGLASHCDAVDPPNEAKNEFTFVVLGDSQFHLPNRFNQVIDEVVHLYPSFVVQVGDMISGYVETEDLFRQQWHRFQAQIAPLEEGGIPFMPVPGNHDLYDSKREIGGEEVYHEVWGDTYYSWDYHNAHFVVLNTDDQGFSGLAGEQLEWLKQDLTTAASKEHIFIFCHRPVFLFENYDELHTLFVEHGVSAVIFGHMHHYNFRERDGIPYIMTVSATHMGTPFPFAAGSFHHMLLVTVRDQTFRVAVIEAGNIYPNDIVAFQDNQDLYFLEKSFFTQREIPFDELKRNGDGYTVTLHVNNPSTQELLAFFEWRLPNERWSVEPLKGRKVVLPAKTNDTPLTFTLRRRFSNPPEAYPSCIARALFLTSDGDVVQSEHTAVIVPTASTEE